MKRLLAILLCGLLAACGGKKAEPLAPGATVLALGDSITAGYGLAPEQAWPLVSLFSCFSFSSDVFPVTLPLMLSVFRFAFPELLISLPVI